MSITMIRKYALSIITIVIMIGFGYLDPIEPITPMGMKILGIFIGCIFGWLTVDVFWPSILGLTLLGFTGYMTVPEVFSSAFANTNTEMLLFMMLLGGLIKASGATEVLTLKLLSMKSMQGHPWRVALVLFIAAFFISVLCGGGVVAVIICWGLLSDISEQVGYKPGDKYPMLVSAALVFIASMGNHFLPFQGSVVSSKGYAAMELDFSSQYTTYSIIFTVIMVAVYMFLLRVIFRPDTTPLTREFKIEGNKTFSVEQKLILIIVAILFMALLIPSYLAPDNAVRVFLKSFGDHILVAIALAISSFILYRDKPLMTIQAMGQTGVSWSVFFMVMSAFTLSSALTSQNTGVVPFINATVAPFFEGKSQFFFVAVSIILAAIATNIINNAVVAAIFMPVCCNLSVTLGYAPEIVAILLIGASMVGVALPTGSPIGAMLFGYKDWVPGQNALIQGLFAAGLHALLLIVVGYPILSILY